MSPMLFRFPAGFEKHPEQAPGSIDEVRCSTAPRNSKTCPPRGKLLAAAVWSCAGGASIPLPWRLRADRSHDGRPLPCRGDVRLPSRRHCGALPAKRACSRLVSERSCRLAQRRLRRTSFRLLRPCERRLDILRNVEQFSFEIVPGAQQIPSRARRRCRGPSTSASTKSARWRRPAIRASRPPKVARGAICHPRMGLRSRAQRPCRRVFVTVSATNAVAPSMESPRDDVVRDQNVASARFTGFTARSEHGIVPPGQHAWDSSVSQRTVAPSASRLMRRKSRSRRAATQPPNAPLSLRQPLLETDRTCSSAPRADCDTSLGWRHRSTRSLPRPSWTPTASALRLTAASGNRSLERRSVCRTVRIASARERPLRLLGSN